MRDHGTRTELCVPCEEEQPAEPEPTQLVLPDTLPGVRQINIYDASEAA